MLSACLTCKSAQKPKECGAGFVYCVSNSTYVQTMGLCPEFEHVAFRSSALVESAPLLGGSGFPVAGDSAQDQTKLNGRLNLVEQPEIHVSQCETSEGFSSCSASTTATNSSTRTISTQKPVFQEGAV
jgi:hypothetical protein